MKKFLIAAWLMAMSFLNFAQIYEPEGLNMPGAWNSWTNAPTNPVLRNPSQVAGGTLAVTGFGARKWQTQFSVAASGGNLVGGTYEFKFSSGPTSNYWANGWGGSTIAFNTLQASTFGAGNHNITIANGKWYTMNWMDIGYTNTQTIFMETSAQPITVSGITASPTNGNVTSSDAVTLTITASAAPSPEELAYIRYSTDGFSSSSLAPVSFTGATGTATIPAQSAGAVVAYYLFTTTVSNPAIADADKVAIHQHRNGGSNYNYSVNTPLPPVNITFEVNMSQEFVGGSVNIAGSFNGFTPVAMTHSGGGIYTYIASVAQNTNITYKFLNGSTYEGNFGAPCGDGNNRAYAVGNADASVGLVCWNACTACPATRNVTFQVNMSSSTVSGNGVHLAGPFQGWNPATTEMTDLDADGIYTITLPLAEGVTYPFKYVNGNDWPFAENVPGACNSGGNRSVTVGNSDMTIPVVCYALCTVCPAANYDVTFAVNMSQQTVSPNGVHVAGSFQGWNPATTPLTDPDLDGVYTATVSIPENTSFQYKFINGNDWPFAESVPGACATSTNRSGAVATSNVTLSTVCFGLCANCPNGNYDVTFQVNMAGQSISAQGVHLAGSFQGWNPATTAMSDGNADGIYTVTLSMPENTTYYYKFVNGNAWGQDENVPGACNTSGNRSFVLAASNMILGVVCYASCGACPPANDGPANAAFVPGGNAWYPQCATYSGNCSTATNSSQSNAYIGPDVWYSFVADMPSVSIQMSHTNMDGALQLVDASFNPVTGGTENASSATEGTETLNFDGLIAGQTYYVSVGAASGLGGGYSLCIKQLLRSGCATNVSQPLSICSTFKPKWTGANSYTITFSPAQGSIGGGTFTSTGSVSLGNSAFGLVPGNSYYAIVNANYNTLQNAAGDDVDIIVYGSNPSCIVQIAAHDDVQVRSGQRCSAPATLLPTSFLRTDPFVCGVTNYTFEFTPVVGCNDATPAGIPFTYTNTSRIISLSLPGTTSPVGQSIQPQSYYSVRIRPNFGVGGANQGVYGTARTIFVGGSVLETAEALLQPEAEMQRMEEGNQYIAVYPNPNNGQGFVLNATNLQGHSVDVSIIDALGKVVMKQAYSVDGSLQTTIHPNQDLNAGIYCIQVKDGAFIQTIKMLVD